MQKNCILNFSVFLILSKRRNEIQERGIRVSDFAKAIHCNRTNVYSIFARKSMTAEQLSKISKVLDYDFISEYYSQNQKPKKYLIVAERG